MQEQGEPETPDNGVPCMVRESTVLTQWPEGLVVVQGDGSTITITEENSAIDPDSQGLAQGSPNGDAATSAGGESESRRQRSPLGAVLGGLTAGLVAVSTVVLATLWLWRRRCRRRQSQAPLSAEEGLPVAAVSPGQKGSAQGEGGLEVNLSLIHI